MTQHFVALHPEEAASGRFCRWAVRASFERERFKFCVNRKTDIRYVISYRGQNLFFRVLSLFVL